MIPKVSVFGFRTSPSGSRRTSLSGSLRNISPSLREGELNCF